MMLNGFIVNHYILLGCSNWVYVYLFSYWIFGLVEDYWVILIREMLEFSWLRRNLGVRWVSVLI